MGSNVCSVVSLQGTNRTLHGPKEVPTGYEAVSSPNDKNLQGASKFVREYSWFSDTCFNLLSYWFILRRHQWYLGPHATHPIS